MDVENEKQSFFFFRITNIKMGKVVNSETSHSIYGRKTENTKKKKKSCCESVHWPKESNQTYDNQWN